MALPQLPDNLTNLPQDFILADRFRIQKKLGSGGFGVAYKVFDSLGDVVRVIKLVTKDRRSVYERLRREYKTLTNLPDHPHVVKVIWADRMADAKQTPYIVFEYVEGLDVSDLIDDRGAVVGRFGVHRARGRRGTGPSAQARGLPSGRQAFQPALDRQGCSHHRFQRRRLRKRRGSRAVAEHAGICRRITTIQPNRMLRIGLIATSMPWASPFTNA